MSLAGEALTCGCGETFTVQQDGQRSCSRACAARFRVATGKQRGSKSAVSNWRRNADENLCKCTNCIAGRKAALERIAARGLAPRKLTPEEWSQRQHAINAARKQGDTYAWSGE